MTKISTSLLGLGVAAALALSPLGATMASAATTAGDTTGATGAESGATGTGTGTPDSTDSGSDAGGQSAAGADAPSNDAGSAESSAGSGTSTADTTGTPTGADSNAGDSPDANDPIPADEGDGEFGDGDPDTSDFPVKITSITPVGYHDPGFTVTWTVDPEALDEWAGYVEGFAVLAYQPSGLVDGQQTFAGVAQVGFAAGGATVRGGGSASYVYGGDDGPTPATITQAPLQNGMPYQVLVLPTYHGYLLPAVVGAAEGRTNSGAPSAPAEPTSASTGGVTAQVVNGALVAKVPGAAAGQWVYGYAFSSPVGLGWAQVSPTGTATWSLENAGLADGLHHLAVIDDSGAQIGSSEFRVGASLAAAVSPRTLASTGSDADLPLGIAAALLLAGAALITVRRVRAVRAIRTEA